MVFAGLATSEVVMPTIWVPKSAQVKVLLEREMLN